LYRKNATENLKKKGDFLDLPILKKDNMKFELTIFVVEAGVERCDTRGFNPLLYH
jgi:hypothetical protein